MPEADWLVEFREVLELMQDKPAHGQVLVAFGQVEIEHLVHLFYLQTGRENVLVIRELLGHMVGVVMLNEIVKIGRYEFKIVKNTATKIELVRLNVKE